MIVISQNDPNGNCYNKKHSVNLGTGRGKTPPYCKDTNRSQHVPAN